MITYTDTLFEKPKESAQHYTSTQQSRFSLQRIIDNQKRYWINHNPSPVLKPKTLLLADWSATAWSERKVLDVINSLSQVLEDGFRIYVWQKGSLVSLTKETLFYLQDPEFRHNITLVSQQQIKDTAYQQLPRTGPDQIHVVDNYWMNYFLAGGGRAAPASYVVRLSDLPNSPELLSAALDFLQKNTPEVSEIICDKLTVADLLVYRGLEVETRFPNAELTKIFDKIAIPFQMSLTFCTLLQDKRPIQIQGYEFFPDHIGPIIEATIDSQLLSQFYCGYLWEALGTSEYLSINYVADLAPNFWAGGGKDVTKLKALDCIGSSFFTCPKEFFSQFLQQAQNLQSFRWTGVQIPELTEPMVFPNLKYVDLPRDIPQSSIVKLLSGCHHLESLNSIPLTQSTIEQLDLSELKELIYHDRKDDSIRLDCPDLERILSKTTQLVCLTIDIKMRVVKGMNASIALPNLKKITISREYYCSDFIKILAGSHKLEHVDLKWMRGSMGITQETLAVREMTFADILANKSHIHYLALPRFLIPEAIIPILLHCHKLKHLSLKNCPSFNNETIYPRLPALEHLEIEDATQSDFSHIVSEASFLKDLVLNKCMMMDETRELRDFPNLINVTLKGDYKIHRKHLKKLLCHAQNIDLSGATLSPHICAIALPHLKKIKLNNSAQYSNSDLESLLANIPSDAEIDATFSDLCFNDMQQELKTRLEARGATIRQEQLLHVRHPIAPVQDDPIPQALSRSINASRDPRQEHPSRPRLGRAAASGTEGEREQSRNTSHEATQPEENRHLDADTTLRPTEFHMTRVFFPVQNTQATPQAEHLRINVYQDFIVHSQPCDLDHAFEIKRFGDPQIDLPVHPIHYVQTDNLFAMAQHNQLEEGRAPFYAKRSFALTRNWQAMPSLCAQEILTHVRADDLEIQYSSRDNLYYIRTASPRVCEVEWLITVPTEPAPTLPRAIAEIVERYLHFGVGALRIDTPFPTGYDYLSYIEDQEVGACRHRAFAFMAYMREHHARIPVRLISNGCHMFAEVLYVGQWVTCDLGGYPAQLTLDERNNPRPDHPPESEEHLSAPANTPAREEANTGTGQNASVLPVEQPAIIEEQDPPAYLLVADSLISDVVDELSIESYYELRLETWRKTSQPAESIEEYAEQIGAPGKNVLVELPNTHAVNQLSLNLEQEYRKTGRPVYYIDSPDDLRCSSPYLATTGLSPDDHLIGELRHGPGGPLHEFLSTHRDADPVLIVNYAAFDPDDMVRLNSLLDKVRRADSTPVPKKATVIGLLNINKPDCYQGSDFYSRFHVVADCPLSEQSLHDTLPPIFEKVEQFGSGEDIDLFHAADWEARLIGRWVLNQGQFHFEKGALVQALEKGEQSITIQHGPWDDPKFVRFWQSLAVHKTLEYAGQSIAVPAQFTCYQSQNEAYEWPRLTRIARPFEQSESDSPVHILNPSLLPQFLNRYVCDNDTESLRQMPGIIKSAAEHGSLTVQITRELSADHWAMLLAHCEKEKVQLRIDCPPSIPLPWEDRVAQPVIHSELNEAHLSELTTAVIASTDMDSTVAMFQQSATVPWRVFDVSGYEPSDLLTRMNHKFDKRTLRFKFKQKDAALLDLLARGEQVILKGQFSPELLDHLSVLIAERFCNRAAPGRLIMVQDPRSVQAALPILTHHVTSEKKRELLGLPADQTILTTALLQRESLDRLKTRVTQNNPWQGLERLEPVVRMSQPDLPHSQEISKRFDKARLKAVNTRLRNMPYVFLTGLTSVGKTTFVENMITGKQGKLYQGEQALKRWARSKSQRRKVLFIDEANFQEWHHLSGLLNVPRGIIIDGDYYPLSEQHKIIFAGNPVNYGDERKLPKLFETYGNALVFDPMPPEYIYERILKPVLPEEILAQTPDITKPWLAAYAFLCERSDQEILISARELQMMAMLTMSYHLHNPGMPLEQVANYYAHHLTKNLVPKLYQASFHTQFPEPDPLPLLDLSDPSVPQTDFLMTASRQPLVAQLTDLLALRTYKRSEQVQHDAQRYGGLGGIVIEGESGIGKSELVTALLKQYGYAETHYAAPSSFAGNRFYRLSVDMDMGQKIRLLHQAFDEGSVVIMDEINSSPMMERILNSLLMGKTLKGERPTRPGFMLIGTQNPLTYAGGRRAPSNALARRLMTVTLPLYPRNEMFDILATKIGQQRAAIMVGAYERNRAYALAKNLRPLPNFRDVINIADEEAGIIHAPAVFEEEPESMFIDDEDELDTESLASDALDERFEEDEDSEDELQAQGLQIGDLEQPMMDRDVSMENPAVLSLQASQNQVEEEMPGRQPIHLRQEDNHRVEIQAPPPVPAPQNGRDMESRIPNPAPLPNVLPIPPTRNWSLYFLWLGAVVFAIIAIIAFCLALNVLMAPTVGMGPFALALASALSIQAMPPIIGLGYVATGVASGLLSACFFKSIAARTDRQHELDLAPNLHG